MFQVRFPIQLLNETNLLTSWELELGTTQSLDNLSLETITGTDRHDWLADVHTCNGTLWFAEGTSHSSLEPADEQKVY